MLCFLFALFTVLAGRWSLRCTFVCCSHGSMICAPPVSCFSRVLYNQGFYQPWKYSILFCWFFKEFSLCELVIGSKKIGFFLLSPDHNFQSHFHFYRLFLAVIYFCKSSNGNFKVMCTLTRKVKTRLEVGRFVSFQTRKSSSPLFCALLTRWLLSL